METFAQGIIEVVFGSAARAARRRRAAEFATSHGLKTDDAERGLRLLTAAADACERS